MSLKVNQIIIDEVQKITSGITLMHEVKNGLRESALKYNEKKTAATIEKDKFLKQVSKSKKITPEEIFYVYILGDKSLTNLYKKQ